MESNPARLRGGNGAVWGKFSAPGKRGFTREVIALIRSGKSRNEPLPGRGEAAAPLRAKTAARTPTCHRVPSGAAGEPGSPRCCQPRPLKPSCRHNGCKPDSGPTNPHGNESGAESRRAASRALRLPQPAAHPPASLGGCRQRGTTATRPPRPAARPAGIPCSSPPARCVQTPAAPPRSLPPRTRTGSRGGPASISAVPMATAGRADGKGARRRGGSASSDSSALPCPAGPSSLQRSPQGLLCWRSARAQAGGRPSFEFI